MRKQIGRLWSTSMSLLAGARRCQSPGCTAIHPTLNPALHSACTACAARGRVASAEAGVGQVGHPESYPERRTKTPPNSCLCLGLQSFSNDGVCILISVARSGLGIPRLAGWLQAYSSPPPATGLYTHRRPPLARTQS
ncbi:hypothetical protein BKA66DRAFT_460397 [Pyrenochaeta sp. MPI-SDFR-AT-0127]|nr:hypothetical protein BKA66DRAFT_460397 [Pyrenochaeta sp. MPI-SDFR-AT-0127]